MRFTPALPAVVLFTMAGGGSALAEDARVRTTATVEVIDDKAEIDEVIARMRSQMAPTTFRETKPRPAPLPLRQERPPAPPLTSESHRALGPEPKPQPPGARKPAREREIGSERTERPRPKSR
jgi:hypothetical protein